MSASERLRELDVAMRISTPTARPLYEKARNAESSVLRALPEIVAVIEGAENLPEFFQTPDGRTHSFVPLLDALEGKLKSVALNLSDELGGL